MNRLLRTIFPKLFIVMVVVAQPGHTFFTFQTFFLAEY
jgi:hypothetical protein